MNKLISFYNQTGVDHRGRSLRDIWAFDDSELEQTHDYIQWLFPLDEVSKFNFDAPLVDNEVIDAFKNQMDLRINLLTSFDFTMDFYGFDWYSKWGVVLQIQDRFLSQPHWITPNNHNYLRISRILRSLYLLGQPQESLAFFNCLLGIKDKYPNSIGDETLQYWNAASFGKIYNPSVDN